MQDITEFLSLRKEQYLRRAENWEEKIGVIKERIKDNEDAGEIEGHPKAIIPDENGREQLCSAISKQNALLAKVELIEELQEMYFERYGIMPESEERNGKKNQRGKTENH